MCEQWPEANPFLPSVTASFHLHTWCPIGLLWRVIPIELELSVHKTERVYMPVPTFILGVHMSKGVKAWGLLLVLVIFTGLCAALVSADNPFEGNKTVSSNLIYVPDNYTTIQQAVDLATPGDIIIVRDGTYPENVDVYETVTIQSENGSAKCIVEAANSNDHVFEVTADYVNIRGFTVTNATGDWKSGIYLNGVGHCNISDNNASNNSCNGIYLYSSRRNTLTGNTANSNLYGIYLSSSSNNTLTGNNASNNVVGILLEY
jgi:parallel beta-helix repeat protein